MLGSMTGERWKVERGVLLQHRRVIVKKASHWADFGGAAIDERRIHLVLYKFFHWEIHLIKSFSLMVGE